MIGRARGERARPIWLTSFTAAAAVTCVAACGDAQPNATAHSGVDCASYGGCDVLEDHTDGTSTIIPLRTMSYGTADIRARTDAQLPTIVDTAVVGHNPPHTAISNLYHHGPEQ